MLQWDLHVLLFFGECRGVRRAFRLSWLGWVSLPCYFTQYLSLDIWIQFGFGTSQSKVDEFLSLVSSTLESYSQVCTPGNSQQAESQELSDETQFGLALCGIITSESLGKCATLLPISVYVLFHRYSSISIWARLPHAEWEWAKSHWGLSQSALRCTWWEILQLEKASIPYLGIPTGDRDWKSKTSVVVTSLELDSAISILI